MALANPSIAHESETQRQFVRLKMPCAVCMNGRRFTLKDLSSGGFAIEDKTAAYKKGQPFSLTLIIPFEKFSLDVALQAEVQHVNKQQGRIGYRFVDMDAVQTSILHHIIRSYIAGDIVGSRDILNVVARNNFTKLRPPASSQDNHPLNRVKTYGLYLCLIGFAIALCSFIADRLTAQMFTLQSPHGVVDIARYPVAAPTSGIFTSTLSADIKNIRKGTQIGTLTPTGWADGFAVFSPCDCTILTRSVLPGQYAGEGDTLLTLAPQKAKGEITVLIPAQDAHKIRINAPATMILNGNAVPLYGHVSNVLASDKTILDQMATPSIASIIYITPDKPLPIELAGRPVFVTIDL